MLIQGHGVCGSGSRSHCVGRALKLLLQKLEKTERLEHLNPLNPEPECNNPLLKSENPEIPNT